MRLAAMGAAAWLASVGCVGDDPKAAEPTPAQQTQLAMYVLDAPPADMDKKLDIQFEGKVRLLGYKVAPKDVARPGTDVTLTMYWRSDEKLDAGWWLFTHVLNDKGERVLNADELGPLRKMTGFEGQPLPPSRWTPGKVYVDTVTFKVPAEPSPEITVVAGVFKDNTRLSVTGGPADSDNRGIVLRLKTGVAPADARKADVKSLRVERLAAGQKIKIDGKLEEPAWSRAADTGAFVEVGSGRAAPPTAVQGAAKVLWDADNLYVGFHVTDSDVVGGWPMGAKDPHLWEKDTVEIMIDPDGDGDNKDYYEIQINPQNLVFDTQYDGYNSPNGGGKGPFGHEEWSAALKSAVVVNGTADTPGDKDEGYTVEAALPWSSFNKAAASPPKPGDTWRMNFYAMQNNGGTAWSPILGEGNFHRASRFGRVQWIDAGAAGPTAGAASAAPTAPGTTGSRSGPVPATAPAGGRP